MPTPPKSWVLGGVRTAKREIISVVSQAALDFSKVPKVTKSSDFDKIFELDIGNVLKMMCAKFEVHTTHRSDDPYEFANFSQKNFKFLGIPRNS